MAAPVITSVTKTAATTNGTNHAVSLPTLASGDLAIVVFATDGSETVTWPTGWTAQPGGWSDTSNPAATLSIAYRICDGSATDNSGGSITVQTGTNESAVAAVARILAANWHGTTPPEATGQTMASTTTPDPPNESASWGAEDNLFIAGHGGDGVNGGTISNYPSGYTDNNDTEQGGNGSGWVSISSKGTTADQADDPGTLTLSTTRHSSGYTIVVRPAAGGEEEITANENEAVTATDSDRVGLGLGTRPSEAVTVSDVDTVVLTPILVDQSESVTVTDDDRVGVNLGVSEEEAVAVVDDDAAELVEGDLAISEFESVAVADDDRVGVNLGVRPSESVSVLDVDTVTANESGIAYDAYSESAGTTGDHSWTHTPTGTPAGVVVAIVQNDSATDQLTGVDPVTYGSLALTRVRFDPHSGGEPGGVYLYWAGSSIPTGAQTITVSKDAAEASRCSAWTVTAGSNIEIDTSNGSTGIADDPSLTLSTSSGVTTFIVAGLMSGQGAASATQAGADFTLHMNNDAGGQTRHTERRTTNATGGNVTVDFVTDASDDYALSAVALRVGAPDALTPSSSDSVTVTDTATAVVTPLVVSESEPVTVTDVDTVARQTVRVTVSESESVTVADDDTVALVGADLSRSVSDAVTVSDVDTVTVDTVRVTVDAFESVTSADDDRVGLGLGVRPTEAVTVSDVDTVQVNAAADLEVSSSDPVTVADVDTVLLETVRVTVSEAESVSVEDADTVALDPLVVSEADTVAVADVDTVAVAGGAPLTVSEGETISASDQPVVVVTPLTISASESISAADVATIARTTIRIAVDVSDAVTAADADTVAVDPLLIEAQEAISAAESVTMDGLAIPIPAILYGANASLTPRRTNTSLTPRRRNVSLVAVRRNTAVPE